MTVVKTIFYLINSFGLENFPFCNRAGCVYDIHVWDWDGILIVNLDQARIRTRIASWNSIEIWRFINQTGKNPDLHNTKFFNWIPAPNTEGVLEYWIIYYPHWHLTTLCTMQWFDELLHHPRRYNTFQLAHRNANRGHIPTRARTCLAIIIKSKRGFYGPHTSKEVWVE